MKPRLSMIICLILVMALTVGCKRNPDDDQVRAGFAGAGLGAVAGLALGAMAGDAAMGAAVGATMGATSGVAYEYDSRRADRRNNEMVAAITTNQQAGTAQAAPTPQNETVAQSGKRHLDDFLGEWNISAWALRGDGTKISGTGKGKVIMDTKESARFSLSDLDVDGVTHDVDASAVLGYSERNGFTLECTSSAYQGTRKYVGEYIPQSNEYNFYPTDAASSTGTTGVVRSNIKTVIKASANMISINTFSMIDGAEVNIQSYRFTK